MSGANCKMKLFVNSAVFLLLSFLYIQPGYAQSDNFRAIRAEVYFSEKLRVWDGFGVNYVEEAQYREIESRRQDYGGFSYLKEPEKLKIIDMIFGADGLQPAIVKMFLDPFHQDVPGGGYNHTKTTENMLFFVENGLKTTRKDDRDLTIITTLYGPPAYMTKQKIIRGRDFDMNHKKDLAKYFISWADFLVRERELPLEYISLHNEGDDWQRWPVDGRDSEDHYSHDYNMYWPPELVVDFLKVMPGKLSEAGLGHIGVTPGESYAWDRFMDYGYARAIAADEEALNNLALITCHGFMSWGWGRWNTCHTSAGNDIIRKHRPEMRSWVTSTSWSSMDAVFIREIYGNIYNSKVNAIIPWAVVQRPGLWAGGDPNAGCAFHVHDDGTFHVRKGYYFYKQVTRAGRPGMAVAAAISMDPQIKIIGFASNGTEHPDAFVVINISDAEKRVHIKLNGHDADAFQAWRTTNDEKDLYTYTGKHELFDNVIEYIAPKGSVTTFFAE